MPDSHRGPIHERMPIIRPGTQIGTALKLSEDTVLQIAHVWEADLIKLRLELLLIQQQLKPWYVRLWEWWRGE